MQRDKRDLKKMGSYLKTQMLVCSAFHIVTTEVLFNMFPIQSLNKHILNNEFAW